jgi:diadenosine tetraphosphate (Ap4A) HIT family hydrolase/5-methylcytosine-specific restriction endonuclease McrA
MDYNQLKYFLLNKMRMSHVYQPVMIQQLLRNGGRSSVTEIAKDISQHDPSQIEYYENVTNNMVGKVLRNHDIVEKDGKSYILKQFETFSNNQKDELIEICKQKLDEYIVKRGEAIWQHRRKGRIPISGSIRYEVLKRAKSRCELCGCSHEERALEVDHIVPKSLGGEDSINNYQALCYSCNSSKNNNDDTDMRGVREKYEVRISSCIFCDVNKKKIIEQNNLALLMFDQYPVTSGHMLIIPKRHSENYFSLFQPEFNAVNQLLNHGKEMMLAKDKTIEGFNIGMNAGEVAGQTIFHTHIHLIPRRKGDVENARGGVRGVIPGKREY